MLNKVLLTRDRITLTEYENMPRSDYDIYIAILNEIGKGEKHKADVENAKIKAKTKK